MITILMVFITHEYLFSHYTSTDSIVEMLLVLSTNMIATNHYTFAKRNVVHYDLHSGLSDLSIGEITSDQ